MIKTKTTLKTKGLDNVVKSLKKLEAVVTQYGYFDGKLHKASKQQGEIITLASIMGAHEYGQGKLPERPVFQKTGYQLLDSLPAKAKPIVRQYLVMAISGVQPPQKMLTELGDILRKETQGNFGNASLLKVTNNSTPLIDTKELRDSMEVRVKRK